MLVHFFKILLFVDNTAPVITLNDGVDPTFVEQGQDYTENSATASDDVDGDFPADIGGQTVDTISAVDTEFTVTYDKTDAAGNVAVQMTRKVIITVGKYRYLLLRKLIPLIF